MANLYYREDLPASAFEVGATVEVTGDEARHAVRVARLRLGERIMVGDGAGAIGTGEVIATDRDRFAVRLTEARKDPLPARPLVLVQALAKGDRDERAIEQATEFGVDIVMPWQAARSVSRWEGDDKAAKGSERWRRIAREASKQALRSRVPVVTPRVSLEEVRGFARAGAEVLVLHPAGADALSDHMFGDRAPSPLRADAAHGDPVEGVLVVVGPEGGIDDAELEALAAAGAHVLRLGATVLRTSSAGPAALAVLNVALGRW